MLLKFSSTEIQKLEKPGQPL